MNFCDCLPMDEVFTHISDDGTVRHFNPSAMYRAVPKLLIEGRVQRIRAEMDLGFVDFILRRRGVESPKLSRMKEPYLSIPIIGAEMADGTVLTVDGHHRLVVLARKDVKTYEMFLFPQKEWEAFLVDMPEEFSDFLAVDVYQGQGMAEAVGF